MILGDRILFFAKIGAVFVKNHQYLFGHLLQKN